MIGGGQTTPPIVKIVCPSCGRKWTSLDWIDPQKQLREHRCSPC